MVIVANWVQWVVFPSLAVILLTFLVTLLVMYLREQKEIRAANPEPRVKGPRNMRGLVIGGIVSAVAVGFNLFIGVVSYKRMRP